MSIAFWGDEKSAGLELLSIQQFIELLSREESRNEVGHREGLNLIVNGIVENKFKKPAYVNVLSTDYVEPIDITDTIIPSERDEYSRISQLLQGETRQLECRLTMPSQKLTKQIEKEKIKHQDIPYVSFMIGPFGEGRQVFRLYLHVKNVEQKKEGSENFSWYTLRGIKSTVSFMNIVLSHLSKKNSNMSKEEFDAFKEYYQSNIEGQIIFPQTSMITVIARNTLKIPDWAGIVISPQEHKIRLPYFMYIDYPTTSSVIDIYNPKYH